MSEDTRSTLIGGIRFDMRLLKGRAARAVGNRVKPVILRVLQVAVSSLKMGQSKKLDELDWGDMGGLLAAAATLFENLSDDDREFLVQSFAQETKVWLRSPAVGDASVYETPLTNRIDDIFVGKPYLEDEWLVWAVQQNGFFDLAALVAKLSPKAAAAPSASPTAATGFSGGSSSASG